MKSLVLGTDARGRGVTLSEEERASHMHVIGSSGSGKSKFLESMIRQDLRNRQGFCLIDPHGTLYRDVLDYAAHHVLERDIVLLNLSEPTHILGFNPFRRMQTGDISVQVDRRIIATMHAWGVANTDETPTLERTLRLIYTLLVEQNLSFEGAQHLIDFNAREIREELIAKIEAPLIRNEWAELQKSVESFNAGASVADSLTTVDSCGRSWLQQTLQGPGATAWDTVETDYDHNGRVSHVSLPFSDTAGSEDSGAYGTSTAYDGLNRPLQISDAAGGITQYVYTLNDVLTTVSPAPTGENTKSRQLQFDGLGRPTTVCEITTISGSGTCTQNTAATGFFTSYIYDPLGNLGSVTQDTQVRTYTYDGLSRMISDRNPETSSNGLGGTTSYTYDTDTTCGTYNGDKVKRVDAAGNVTCYAWDPLHRIMNINYLSGPNQANTLNKGFQYDLSAPLGFTQTNPRGRMVVAFTENGSTWNGWEAFGYDAAGRTTDLYSLPPQSSASYHMQQGYAANGATTTIQGFNGTGTSTPFTHLLAFNQDGEGRPYGSWDVTNGSTVYWGGTNYNAASQPTSVSLTSGAESFVYDAKSARTTRWQSTAGTSTQTGNLTWNPNGTLQKMVIADNANSGNAQTCTYGYDDLVRLLNATCGSAWAQTFAYDFYGNIWKAGNVNFQNGYGSGNHVLGFTYDGNGDVTNDGVNTYTYDAEGRATAEAGKTLLYDAFDRLSSIGGAQVLYLPSGQKFAFMNGTTVQSYITPMAAGMQAVWNGTGLAYYRHADWLGSARFESTPTGTVYADRAYAPFGETYAEIGAVDRSFTGQTQDVAPGGTGLYDFLLRQQSAAQGLWLVPDPAGLAAVDITNPQTWNRYAYVGNNPLGNIDPLGQKMLPGDWAMLYSMSGFGIDGMGVFAGGCEADGVGTACSTVFSLLRTNGAVLCPNNDCGIGTYAPFRCLGNNCGYASNDYFSTHSYECNGQPCTMAEWNQMVQPYTNRMQGIVAGQLGVNSSSLTYDHMNGGNANFIVSANIEQAYVSGNDDCSGAKAVRCDAAIGSLHFLPVPGPVDQDGNPINYFVHLDSANPLSTSGFLGLSFSGLKTHVGMDVLGGNTIWSTGVPHP